PTGGAASDGSDGAKHYKRCAACHLPTGKGVPGAYPPLKDKLATFYDDPEGRAYLVLVLSKGMTGSIEIDGVTYRGFMPAQGRALKDEGVASVLNYILREFHEGNDSAAFTSKEVKEIVAAHPKLKARDLAKMRQLLVTSSKGE
ncbi:MAG: cytochrome c, partial [Kordiimonas sp.]